MDNIEVGDVVLYDSAVKGIGFGLVRKVYVVKASHYEDEIGEYEFLIDYAFGEAPCEYVHSSNIKSVYRRVPENVK